MLRAISDNIIIKPLNSEEKTAGGIIIPDNCREKARIGIVAAVGPGHVNSLGQIVPTEIKEGDKVAFPHHAGNEVKYEGVNYLVMREDIILATIQEDDDGFEAVI